MTLIIALSLLPCISLAVLTMMLLRPQPVKVRSTQHDDTHPAPK